MKNCGRFRYRLRREMIEFVRRRSLYLTSRISAGDFIRFEHLLNPDALTIGFARRFATYKRAPLIFQQFDNIIKLCKDQQRPIQFIFAGKAHPRCDLTGERVHLNRSFIYATQRALGVSCVCGRLHDVHVAPADGQRLRYLAE